LTPDTNKQDYFLQKMLDNANRAYELGQKAKGGFIRAYGYLAKYNAYKTLADLAKNENEKIKSLTIAVEAAKNHIVHTIESRTGMITAQLRTGLLLEELGILSQNNDVLRDCKEYFLKVINECIERGYKSYAANAYQYAARIEDRLGNHMSSAHNYEKSREIYEDSLKNIEYKPLINRIKEKMQYSLAWNLIENAKVNHKGENHLKAKEFYLKAFDILKSVARYNFEAPYYMAWALLEEAEQVSKQEQQKNAIEIYEKTINAFKNAIRSLEKANKQTNDERELVRINKLMKVAEIRINYCSARINLENARLLGRKGEHTTAADLFASAASKFRNICTRFKLERERKELEAIYFLCRAWESMEFAEKYEEHTRFAEAAALFSKASNLFSDTKMKFLSSANSAFCQALEFGCKFDQTLETEIKTELYPKVKVILSKASSLYEKGGFKSGADWAQATSIYFDAAWQLIKADEEIDLSKKGNLLKIGSEYLKSAIELFGKAGYKEKEIEVQDRLYRVEKEEKILLSALSTIQEPSISRSTIGIVAPTCPIETSESPRLGEIRQFSEEINQASNRVKREKEFKPTLIVEEEPIVLLILTTGGIPIFSYPFADEWKFDDELFGGFMSSFSSISDEIFSEGLDRAKFGSYTVLMESVSNFLICYLFKGQIFLAKQKLIKFVERIQDSTSIWQTLNKFQKTSQVVELRDIPVMESLLTEIFLVESS
jgi:tetratricopeptide (TPR) repeat protein